MCLPEPPARGPCWAHGWAGRQIRGETSCMHACARASRCCGTRARARRAERPGRPDSLPRTFGFDRWSVCGRVHKAASIPLIHSHLPDLHPLPSQGTLSSPPRCPFTPTKGGPPLLTAHSHLGDPTLLAPIRAHRPPTFPLNFPPNSPPRSPSTSPPTPPPKPPTLSTPSFPRRSSSIPPSSAACSTPPLRWPSSRVHPSRQSRASVARCDLPWLLLIALDCRDHQDGLGHPCSVAMGI